MPAAASTPDLPHAAAQHLPVAPGLVDEVPGAADDRADRGGQPFAQAEGDRVGVGDQVFRVNAERDRRVEEPCAVDVQAQAASVRKVCRPACVYSTVSGTPPQRLCVFSRQISRDRGAWSSSGRIAAARSSRSIVPSAWLRTICGMMPPSAAQPPCS